MNALDALHVVADNALLHAGEDRSARLAIYDALSILAEHAGLVDDAREAAVTASALRGAETLEMMFSRRVGRREDHR